MIKSAIAIFFSLLFMTLLTAPTLVMAMEADHDVSIFLDSNEEEEKEGKESLNDIEVKILQNSHKVSSHLKFSDTSILGFCSDKYSCTHSELISPPPEYRLL